MRMSVGERRRVKEGEEHTTHLSPDNGCEALHSTSSHRTHASTHARTHTRGEQMYKRWQECCQALADLGAFRVDMQSSEDENES